MGSQGKRRGGRDGEEEEYGWVGHWGWGGWRCGGTRDDIAVAHRLMMRWEKDGLLPTSRAPCQRPVLGSIVS